MARFAQALKWSFLTELAARAVQPVIFLVLARLLLPDDYGVMAAAVMVISLSQILETGMAKAIIQYPGDVAQAADSAFWTNIALGLAATCGLFLLSGPIAGVIFQDARVGPVLKAMSLQVLMTAGMSVQIAILQREMRFKHIFYVRVATVAIPGLISIPLAVQGWGYWALVIGALVGTLASTVIFWISSPWKPGLTFDPATSAKLARFGGWVAGASLLGWGYQWADSLFVGMHMSTAELGTYYTGSMLAQTIYAIIFGPLLPVLYAHLSRVSHRAGYIREALLLVQRALFLVALPLGIGMNLFGDQVHLLLGAKWASAGLVIAILGLMGSLSWLMGGNDEAFRSMGKPDVMAKILSIKMAIYLPVYYVASQHGLETFLWVRFGLCVLTIPVDLYFLRQRLGIPAWKALGNAMPVVLIASVYSLFYYLLRDFVTAESEPLQFLLAASLYAFLCLALSAPLAMSLLRDMGALGRNVGELAAPRTA